MLENILKQLKNLSNPVNRLELEGEALTFFACCRLGQAMLNHKDTISVVKLKGVTLDKPKLNQLADALKTFKNLVELDLSDNPLTDSSAELLQDLWLNLPDLQTLNLAKTGIGKKTIQTVAEMLSKDLILQTLDLSHNALTEEAGSILCAALAINTRLNKLNLEGNNFFNALNYFINYFITKAKKEKSPTFSTREEYLKYLSHELQEWLEKQSVLFEKSTVGNGEEIISLCLLPNQDFLGIGIGAGGTIIWNLQTQEKVQILPALYQNPKLNILSNGQFVYSHNREDQNVIWKIWQFNLTSQQWEDIQTSDESIGNVFELPEGQAIGAITSVYGSELRIWNVTSTPWAVIQKVTENKRMKVLQFHEQEIFISSGKSDPTVRSASIYTLDVWRKAAGIWQLDHSIPLTYLIDKLLVSADGSLLSGGDGKVSTLEKDISGQWKLQKTLDFERKIMSAQPLLGLTKNLAIICHVCSSFVGSTYDVEIWDMAHNKPIKFIERYYNGQDEYFSYIFTPTHIFTPINTEMFITQGLDWQVRSDIRHPSFKLWRIEKDYSIKLVREFNVPKDETNGPTYPLVLLPDKRIAIGAGSGELALCTLPDLYKDEQLIAAIVEQVEILQGATKKLEVKLPVSKTKTETAKKKEHSVKSSTEANTQFFTSSQCYHSTSNNNVTNEENMSTKLQVRRIRIDKFRPSRRAERKDFLALQAKHPQAIFLLLNNYSDYDLTPQSLHTASARGSLAAVMRPNRIAGSDSNPVYDLSIIGIPTGSHDRTVTEISLQQHIKKAFVQVYTQLKLGRPIFIPYKLKGTNVIPAFGKGVQKLSENLRDFIHKQFKDLEDFSKGKLDLKALDDDYQLAWQKADSVRDKWPVAQEVYSMPATPSFKL